MSPAPPLAPLARVAPRALRPRRLPGTRSARFRTPVARAVAHGCSPAPSVALFAVARPSGWQSGAPARPTPVRAASLAAVPPVLALPAPRAAAGPALALLAVARPSGWRSGAPTRPTLARAALAPLAPLAAAHPALALPAPRAAARSARCGAPVGVAEEARAAATCCRTWERNRGAGGGGSSSASSLEMAGSVGRREGEHAGRLPWQSFAKMLAEKQFRETEEMKAKVQISHAQPDDLIDFYHLKSRRGMSQLELEDEVQDDLKAATGGFTKETDDANRLNRILQLTGFSDPVYAEAFVTVHHYDIVLDVTVINRTKETLQNLCLELATMGDLKLVDRPQNYTLAPESSKQIRANIKVSSTETGVIFGNIVYETSNVMERSVVVLNDIHIDIMDYISPATCADVTFRNMWAEFEWENKVAVNTVIQDEKEFLNHVIKSTNMKCLTPPSALDGECGFLAANLYAKSVFGEDALVNISIEKQVDGKLSGYIRIRSKTQGIALSLGDKITLKQKGGSN